MLAVGLLLASSQAVGRSAAAVSAFKRHNPCPSTGARRGSCPGYVVDHVVPLCAGGFDGMPNLQWQTIADAKVKDRQERRECRQLRRANPTNPQPAHR